jgi:hypothetical protein
MESQKRPTDIKIDQTKFNKAFAEADSEMSNRKKKLDKRKNKSNNRKMNSVTFKKKYEDDDMDPFEPRQYTEDLGINIKNLFFDVLEMLANGKNPIPYVMQNPKKQFVFSVMIICIGVLLLFFSNLMI